MKLSFALSSLLLTSVNAVLYGDEQFGSINGGRFWVFGSNGVSVVNPQTCSVEANINTDSQGNLLPGRWYDGVYMEGVGSKKYVAINSAVGVSDTHGEQSAAGEVLLFDTDKKKVASRVIVGPRPVHSYGVYTHNQYWTHSDGDGYFYIIDLSKEIDDHTNKPIQVHVDTPSHGKLMWDEDGALDNTGYATSTGEPILFIFDMDTHETIGQFDFSEWCNASHSIGFSSVNKHLYIECSRGADALLELDVSSPRDPQYVKAHMGITGSIYETPDKKAIAVTDKGGSKFHLVEPGSTGTAASNIHTVDVYGHPSGPAFYENDSNGNVNYNTCLSLTINTNKNHYQGGDLKCSYYGCSPAKTQADVDSGVCLYATDADGKETKNLQTVDFADLSSLSGKDFADACQRCTNELNYDEEDNTCVCTPNCGSCAANNPEDHDANLSGSVCFDMSTMLARRKLKSDPQQTFIPAGSVKQGSPYAYSSQCGFGRTYRTHKKGGKFDVIPYQFPTNGVSIINMEDFKLKCQVELGGSPSRIIYVPPSPEDEKNNSTFAAMPEGISTVAFVAIFAGAAVVLVLVAVLVVGGRNRNKKQREEASAGVPAPEQAARPSQQHNYV